MFQTLAGWIHRRRHPSVLDDTEVRPIVDRGPFTHGFCTSCGWEGPGRRARNVAEDDIALHRLTGCGLDPDAALAALVQEHAAHRD